MDATGISDDREISCHSNGELSRLPANVDGEKVAESVVMVTMSNHCYGNTVNNRHSNGEVLNSAADVAKEPVVMVTTSSVANCCHSNSKVTAETANDVATETVVMATNRHNGENILHSNKEKCDKRREPSSLADEADVNISMESDKASEDDRHGNREAFAVAGSVMVIDGVRKKRKRLKLCTEVTMSVLLF